MISTRHLLPFSLIYLLASCGRQKSKPQEIGNRLRLGPAATVHGKLSLPIHPFSNLNYKSREELFALRSTAVAEHPELMDGTYVPGAAFKDIESGKPWWGFGGLDHFGPGPRSIEGLSLQSSYFTNPYVLMGIHPEFGLWNVIGPTGEDTPKVAPVELVWDAQAATASVTYDVGDYFRFLDRYPGYAKTLQLLGYNAKDFGYEYFWLDSADSSNVEWQSKTRAPAAQNQYIHCGHSCNYPGGCNNMSPTAKESKLISIVRLPATARLKLWRQRPASADDPADMSFIIEMK